VGVTDPIEELNELRIATLRDRPLLSVLWKQGYLPFARPADGSYDPVCFDFSTNEHSSEPAVVRIDHEDVLSRELIRIRQVVSPAFHLLVEDMTTGLSSTKPNR
jgi:hypothetical protein